MAIADRIPDFSDKELDCLQANALRLKEFGCATQRQQAEELLPLLSAASEDRKAVRVTVQAETRRANAKRKSP